MHIPKEGRDTMTPSRRPQSGHGPLRRRRFLIAGTAVSTTILAGCSGQTGSDTDGTGPTPETTTDDGTTPRTDTTTDGPASKDAGTFRLLISDRPAAIDDFDSLTVTFDRARVFRKGDQQPEEEAETDDEAGADETDEADEAESEDEGDGTETEDEADETEAEVEADETETEGETTTETSDGTAGDESDESGFFVLDLDGATVDLTQVVGDRAMGVFEDDLPAGQYSKIELYASDVEGVVGGELAAVKIPSGKLQIVKSFEVAADETVEFVFDINVVKKGQSHDYNLLPVISESGVAGRDVSMEEINSGQQGSGEGRQESETDGNGSDETETDTDRGTGPQSGNGTETGEV